MLFVALPHPHQQEDGVVDREPEDDAEDHRRPDRVDVGVAAQRIALGDVEEQGQDAEGDADRGQVEQDRDRRQQERPQDQDHDQEGGEGDGGDDEGDRFAGDVAVVGQLRSAAGHPDLEIGLVGEFFGVAFEPAVEGDRPGRVEGVARDHQDHRRLAAAFEVDRPGGAVAFGGGWPVERREHEVAGVEETGRGAVQPIELAVQFAGPIGDFDARVVEPGLQRFGSDRPGGEVAFQ